MVYFKVKEVDNGQVLDAHFGPNNELYLEVKDFEDNFQSIILNSDQVDELLMFLQKKIK